jgi:formyltetrahydrofolate deformylase
LSEFILTLSCDDRSGLVHAVSSWLVDQACNILDSAQFRDDLSERFFMRVHFEGATKLPILKQSYQEIGKAHHMDWQIWPSDVPPKVLLLVSRVDHCLADLLYRRKIGELKIDVPLVVSNHRDAYPLAASHDVDFLHLPVSPETKTDQEARLLKEIEDRGIDFLVLARYMQILTPEFCEKFPGRIINIHHSFLPGFKGARPYHQAHQRGVKLIGATAHYVSADLDEGPIIEQDVERVDHRMGAEQLAAVGRDIERVVLAKAVAYQAEHRVLLNGNRTVVFN